VKQQRRSLYLLYIARNEMSEHTERNKGEYSFHICSNPTKATNKAPSIVTSEYKDSEI